MNSSRFKIDRLHSSQIPFVKNFPPSDWHFNFQAFLEMHLNQPYFQGFVAFQNEEIMGVGNVLINGSVGWLGNIIVPETFRRQGIGQAITEFLIQQLKEQGCRTQLLIATRMGEKLYEKSGFRTSSFYHFYRPKFLVLPELKTIRPVSFDDFPKILALDRIVTGENRQKFLNRFLTTAWVDENPVTRKIEGYFLPDLGNGLIIGINEAAGLRLLQFKHAQFDRIGVLPEQNLSARQFLLNSGFVEYMRAPRMVLGEEVDWKPDWIFARGAGYCG
ncbi:GNAT family N-acetyltransferase [candidate division KSB1 bacterium]|nr:GNAT family N-acetyltransferase [candidate division KSB1 bacterium]